MAGVDHSYQYSVEVKSRFSLFLDDSLNNEDPDVLISKLQTKRNDRVKKEKSCTSVPEVKPVAAPPAVEVKAESLPKPQVVKPPKAVPAQAQPTVDDHTTDQLNEPPPYTQAPFRGRGDGGFHRGFRGRARGFRPPFHEATSDATGDPREQSMTGFEPRGRGRGRGRFFRGRGSGYTDHRTNDYHQGPDYGAPRPHFASEVQSHDPEQEKMNGSADHTGALDQDSNEPEAATEQDTPEKVEEEPVVYTLEEYKAMRSTSKPVIALSSKNSRKANDGKDVFANMVPHRKINEVSDDEDEFEVIEKPVEPEPFDIDVSFTDRHNGRGIGSRGAPRGRGVPNFRSGMRSRGPPNSRGGFRGDRGRGLARKQFPEHQPAPVINSDKDFPSLK